MSDLHKYATKLIDTGFLVLLLFLIVSGAILLTPSIHGNDGVLNFVYLRSFIEDGDLDFANDFQEFDRRKNYTYKFTNLPRDSLTGHYVNRYGIGSAILWSPFYLGLRFVTRALPAGLEFDSFGKSAELAVSLGSFFYCASGLLILYLFLRSHFFVFVSLYAVVFILLATPLAFYTYFHPSMSHANAFSLMTLWLILYLSIFHNFSNRFSLIRWGVLGFVSSLLIMTRFQDAIVLVVLVIGELWFWLKRNISTPVPRQVLSAYLLFLITLLVTFTPQLLVWNYLYGSLFSGPSPYLQYPEFNLLYPRHFFKVLFSPWHGLFYWHPVLFLSLVGLMIGVFKPVGDISNLLHRNPIFISRTCLLFLILFLFEVYLVACWQVWHAGASLGQRLLITTFPALSYGIAIIVALTKKNWHKLALVILLGLAILWNANLIWQYATNRIPHESPVTWLQMLSLNRVHP
ncbi:MAG: hypothetical protein N2246_00840 [Candidatus Sumerlaeia bacterium]|nr:hypothetical protein [Candidatus Sumerlaeia bacterium]